MKNKQTVKVCCCIEKVTFTMEIESNVNEQDLFPSNCSEQSKFSPRNLIKSFSFYQIRVD